MLFEKFPQLGDFLIVIFPVQDFPFSASFLDRLFLGVDLIDRFLIQEFVEFELFFDAVDDRKPDFIGFIQEFDLIILEESVEYLAREIIYFFSR